MTVEYEDNPPVQVEVLDTDTIEQAKEKIMEVLFKVSLNIAIWIFCTLRVFLLHFLCATVVTVYSKWSTSWYTV